MKVQLLIAGMNRTEYLTQVRRALALHHPDLYLARIESHDTGGLGMAKGIQAGWDLALERDWDYLLHHEEDMLPLAVYPLNAAVGILESDPSLANVVFKREPWSSEEYAAGDVIAASCAYDPDAEARWDERCQWTVHSHIFSLNPCLIPRRIVEEGWPVGNEAEKTQTLRDAGFRFAFFGVAGDPPLVRHIGSERGAGWKL